MNKILKGMVIANLQLFNFVATLMIKDWNKKGKHTITLIENKGGDL